MTIRNKTKRPLYINVLNKDKSRDVVKVEPKSTLTDERIVETDVQTYKAKKMVEIVSEEKATKKEPKKKDEKPIITLPENPTLESLNDMDIEEKKEYCRQNNISGFSGKNDEELSQLILDALSKKEATKKSEK